MKIKVCGMRNPENISELTKLGIDYIGYIFYEKSSRFVAQNPAIEIAENIQKVGVFVNECKENVLSKTKEYQLDIVQLHGNESPEFCQELSEKGVPVMKAFSVGDAFDFSQLDSYASCCELFLLDDKGDKYGGNGTSFNWQLLKQYTSEVPFLLSGGIGLTHIDQILHLDHPKMVGIDVNSGFETSPGLKDIEKVKEMVEKIRNHG